MSGFEIIGVVLGGLPLIIKVAEDYKKGLEPLDKWIRYKHKFRTFVNDVDIEKQMFDALVDRLLQYTNLSPDQRRMLLTGEDEDGWCHAEVDEALRRRLGESYDACMYLLESMKDDLLKLQAMLCLKDGSVDWVKPGEDKWNYQRKRISHSFSKKGPETVESLAKDNRKFRDLLDVLDRNVETRKTEQKKAISKDTTWAKIFECIRRQANSLHSALKNGWKCSCEVPHLATLQLQERATGDWSSHFILTFASPSRCQKRSPQRKVLVTVKQQAKAIEAPPSSRPQPMPVQEGYLVKLRSNIESASENNQLGICKQQHAPRSISAPMSSTFSSMKKSLKSKSFLTNSGLSSGGVPLTKLPDGNNQGVPISSPGAKPRKTVRMNVLPSISKHEPTLTLQTQTQSTPTLPTTDTLEIESEIEDLCSTLEKLDPSISCLGYLCSPDSHRHEFRSIKDNKPASANYELISLDKLLNRTTRLRITRKQRFRLTVVLASSLLQLQTTPWLTKNMEKRDIFFEYRDSELLAEHPYICHSFPSIKVLTSTPSPSPDTETTAPSSAIRFATKASLNQLGILLLELCFGEAIESRTDIRSNYLVDGKAHNQTDFLTAHEWISEVEHEAGLDFKNAISSCFNFDVKPNWSDINFTQSIHAGVVQPLENILSDLGWADDS